MCLGYSGVYWEKDAYRSIHSEQVRENSSSTQCLELSLVLRVQLWRLPGFANLSLSFVESWESEQTLCVFISSSVKWE